MSYAKDFAQSDHLIYLLLSYLDWKDLMSMALANSILRCYVTKFIKKYIKRILTPFIERKLQKSFWHIMNTINAIICGDFSMTVLASIPKRDVMGNICDIIVPHGRTRLVVNFLESIGYQTFRSDDFLFDEDTAINCQNVFHLQRL